MEEKGKQLQLTGISLDDETTALFMQQLERSNHIAKVQLEETSQIDQKGVKVKQFTLKAGVNYAGEAGSKRNVEQSGSSPASEK
jgi:Tfp pilus assembly protein PilN